MSKITVVVPQTPGSENSPRRTVKNGLAIMISKQCDPLIGMSRLENNLICLQSDMSIWNAWQRGAASHSLASITRK